MAFPILGALAIAIAVMVVGHLLMPKPKMQRSESTRDMDDPTAEAGRPIPVVFGEITLKSPNVLWFGDKDINTYRTSA
jgi:hypothetical protein